MFKTTIKLEIKIIMLSAKELIDTARSETNLNDFIYIEFMEGFEILVDSINKEANLDQKNEVKAREYLIRILVNRLRMDNDIKLHPEILEQEILPPVLIDCMPRTGSTKLHRLLATTGDFFSMMTWQEHNIAPFPDAIPGEPDPRIKDAHEFINWIKKRSPQANEAHPMEAEEVEEDSVMIGLTFRTLFLHIAYFNAQSYADWVMQQDIRIAYKELRRMLQYLQWQYFPGEPRPWVLKTPLHLSNEQAFLDVFPGTHFIAPLRSPVEIIPSTCSLFCGYRKLFSDEDFSQIAAPWVQGAFHQLLTAHLQWRDSHPEIKILDLAFREIMEKPIEVIEQIYAHLQMPFSDATDNSCRQWLKNEHKSSHINHNYTIEEYGLTEESINEMFADYNTRFSAFL